MVSGKDRVIALKTGEFYASIWDQFSEVEWEKFSDDHYVNWSPLPEEFQEWMKGKVCLDAGCGSGRAVRSILLGGASKVCAIDMGGGCIRNTKDRNKEFLDRMELQLASVLDIPYPDNYFDLAHCDGVLHHTTDPKKGFFELVRVLKPGGHMVMAVYGRGGLMNFAIYFARLFRKAIPQKLIFPFVKFITKNPVILYAILDCMYVPIRKNYCADEIYKWFENAGFTDIVRMDSTWGPYGYGRWMRGGGYIKFRATKGKK